ncbi:RNA ligase family protein [Clostridium botulinum]|uniref:RNA ligase family protein n=1 Tax=Clostridium botulinum TaxID=1491 RepID=UPI00174E1A20|nr:RNA ligase family protein [Clostridium botulinum]MBD5589348.1 hypothetical protein [Clostridium botulinum]
MEFRKYQHIERFGADEVDGIEIGKITIMPKIDGTNGSVWLDNNEVKAGSRNRELSLEKDNAGFYKYILSNDNIKKYLKKHPNHRLYGEFLVPHTIKTYREDAWRKFYIFDVALEHEDDTFEYLPYDVYKSMLEDFQLDYIPPLATMTNGTYDSFIKLLDKNNFLIQDGKGFGEGVVIKNYDFINKYNRTTWAKIVTSEFKEKHYKVMGCPNIELEKLIEERIVDDFCTEAFIEKEFNKIKTEKGIWESKYIPMLLSKIYHELIIEETWNIIKKYKNPKIDFKLLNRLITNKIKLVKSNLF